MLLAFLGRDLVEHSGWLTGEQLLDAVAVRQVTPGPVFTTAMFIGYRWLPIIPVNLTAIDPLRA